MKRVVFLIAAVFLLSILPIASADVQLKETPINSIIVKELSLPAKVDITIINNNDYDDSFNIDTLLDINMTPPDKVFVKSNSEKTVTFEIYPSEDLKSKQAGMFAFEYYAKGDKTDIVKSSIFLKFISLKDLIAINMPASVTKDDSEIKVNVSLTEDTTLDTKLTLVSELLSYSKDLTLTKDGTELTIPLSPEMPNAGTYEVKATLSIGDYEYSESKNIVLESVIGTSEGGTESGWFLNKKIVITKENTGNSVADTTITLSKSVVSGLFTTFSTPPATTKRSANTVTYEFTKELNPGETLTVEAKTSYYLPLGILILLIVAGWIFVAVITPQVKVMKKAVKVRTKSGVFATKIVLAVKNTGKNEVNDLKIIDRLPIFTELVPEKFGTISPTEIRKRTLVWHVDKLARNEEIMLSYIVYSKLTIIGKIDVPIAFVTYKDLTGNLREAHSNKLAVIAPEQALVETVVLK
jgi:hypothetical protein